jgi:hypothetical protein
MSFKGQAPRQPRNPSSKPLQPRGGIPLPIALAGMSIFLVSGYGTFLYYKLKMLPMPVEAKLLDKQAIDADVWNQVAPDYDKSIKYVSIKSFLICS